MLATVSNRELNIWATLFLDVVVAVYYFTSVMTMPEISARAMAKLIGKIIVLSIIFSIIVFGAINARGTEKADERDYRFEMRANAIGYSALMVLIAIVLGHIVLNSLFDNWFASFQLREAVTPVFIANLLLLAMIIASSMKALAQLFYYRRGY